MQMIRQTYLMPAPVEDVWQALINPQIINKWGGGPAIMSDQPDTKFELWGGDIFGKNLELIPQQQLIQAWFAGKWPQPSEVTINLNPRDKFTTQLDLIHRNVPDEEAESIDSGWKEYYLGAIQKYLEEVKKSNA
jgi:activator of HSP90 ATPase